MTGFTVMSSELAAAGSWLPSDFTGGDIRCWRCGLAPVEEIAAKVLALDSPDGKDPLRRSRRRCVNQDACDTRVSETKGERR